jgi:alkylation response protein AidB-like acyl-CoA dehydrogenase
MVASPLIYAVYFGIAEAARALVVERLRRTPRDEHRTALVGAIDNELTFGRLALDDMIASYETHAPSPETTNRTLTGRTLVDRSARAVLELAMDALGGIGYLRETGLERRYRDVQAARFHPLREHAQHLYAGELALG